jgi:hypothetical protein
VLFICPWLTGVLGYLDDDNLGWCVTNGQLSSAMCLSCKWNTYIFVHFQVRGVVEVRSFITILPIIVAHFTFKEGKKFMAQVVSRRPLIAVASAQSQVS